MEKHRRRLITRSITLILALCLCVAPLGSMAQEERDLPENVSEIVEVSEAEPEAESEVELVEMQEEASAESVDEPGRDDGMPIPAVLETEEVYEPEEKVSEVEVSEVEAPKEEASQAKVSKEEASKKEVPEAEVLEEAIPETEVSEEMVLVEGDFFVEEEETLDLTGDPDSLLLRYFDHGVERAVGDDEESIASLFYSHYNREKLSGYNRQLYDGTVSMAAAVASGDITETIFTMTIPASEFEGRSWSAQELGASLRDGNGNLNLSAVGNLFFERSNTVRSAIRDCPYEMFWFGNSLGYAYKASAKIVSVDGEERLKVTGDFIFTVKYLVSRDYRDPAGTDAYRTDLAKIRSISSAMENANRIVAQGASLGDLEKLAFFRDQVRGLSQYNYEAASWTGNDYYGDPWQIIYLFDGDPETKVVCEGYSKAFQYLWEKSSFTREIAVYCMSGYLGSEGHMWNMVCIDGENFLVDITNYNPAAGYADHHNLYLAHPISKSTGDGQQYVFLSGESRLTYRYLDESIAMYTEEERALPLYHEYVNDTCKYCGVERKDAEDQILFEPTMSLEDATGMNLYIHLPEGEDPSAYTVRTEPLWSMYADDSKTISLADCDVMDREIDGRTVRCYQLMNLMSAASTEMTDVLKVSLEKNGEEVKTAEYTINGIVHDRLASGTLDEIREDLNKALLQYGFYAQARFGHKTDSMPLIAEDTPALQAIPDSYAASGDPGDFTDIIALFEAKIEMAANVSMNLYLTPAKGVKLSDLSISVLKNGVPYGAVTTQLSGSRIKVKIAGIYSYQMDAPFQIVVSKGGRTAVWTRSLITCAYENSRKGMAAGDTDRVNLMQALYTYFLCARNRWPDR